MTLKPLTQLLLGFEEVEPSDALTHVDTRQNVFRRGGCMSYVWLEGVAECVTFV